MQVKPLILNVIREVTNTGLQVGADRCDVGSNNLHPAKLLEVSLEHPYFTVGKDKIVFLFDVPHLLKALRNNMINHNFQIIDPLVSWELLLIRKVI